MKLHLTAIIVAAAGLAHASPSNILNVSYDVTREFYGEFNPAFAQAYRTKHGIAPTLDLSNGGSSKQAGAVINGLEADVVTMNQETDINAIVNAGLIAKDWKSRLPDNSSPYTSTIVFLVRKGNPKAIKDWSDLVKPGVAVVVPNPKTSGNGRYSYLAAWAFAKSLPGGTDESAAEFVKALFKNVPVLDQGGRAATSTFQQKELGDVLLTFESEALQITKSFAVGQFDLVYPSQSILAEAPASVVDKVVDKRGTRELATEYLKYLWSDEGQKLAVKHYFRPRNAALLVENAALFPAIKLVSIDESFGDWATAHKTHFADGGSFDKIYQAK